MRIYMFQKLTKEKIGFSNFYKSFHPEKGYPLQNLYVNTKFIFTSHVLYKQRGSFILATYVYFCFFNWSIPNNVHLLKFLILIQYHVLVSCFTFELQCYILRQIITIKFRFPFWDLILQFISIKLKDGMG